MTSTKCKTRSSLLAAALAGPPEPSPSFHGGSLRRRRKAFAADDSSAIQASTGQAEQVAVQERESGCAKRHSHAFRHRDLYEYKVDADKRVHKVKGVTAVRNDIEVAGPNVLRPGTERPNWSKS
jgi:hypothetical protein